MGHVLHGSAIAVLDGAVHPLELTVGPRMLGLRPAMIDIVEGRMRARGMAVAWIISLISAGDQPRRRGR